MLQRAEEDGLNTQESRDTHNAHISRHLALPHTTDLYERKTQSERFPSPGADNLAPGPRCPYTRRLQPQQDRHGQRPRNEVIASVMRRIDGADVQCLSDGCSIASATCEQRAPCVNWAHHSARSQIGHTGRCEEREAPVPNLTLNVRILYWQVRRRRGSTAPRPRCLRPTRQWLVSDWWRRRAHASWASVPVRPALADVPSPSTRARARRLVSMAQADGAVLTLVRLGLHLSASAPPHSIRVRARSAGAPAAAPRDDALQESCGRGTRPLQRFGRADRLVSSAEPAQPAG